MISKSQVARNGTPQVQSIIITAITLFALSGLMVGFTVGALVRSPHSSTNNQNQTNLANSVTPTPKPTLTPTTVGPTRLGPPDLALSGPTQNPDGTQTYSVNIQAKDKVDQTKQITADGIACRIWLVPQGADPVHAPGTTTDLINNTKQFQHPETFNQMFPDEVQNALIFNPSTVNETQPCAQGGAKWTFEISPSVDQGAYFLVGLTDWQGMFWNYRWTAITVGTKNQGN